MIWSAIQRCCQPRHSFITCTPRLGITARLHQEKGPHEVRSRKFSPPRVINEICGLNPAHGPDALQSRCQQSNSLAYWHQHHARNLCQFPRATVYMDDIGHMLEPRTHAQFGRGDYCVTHILQIQNLRTHVHIECSQSDKQLHLTWLLPFSNHTSKRSTGCPSIAHLGKFSEHSGKLAGVIL